MKQTINIISSIVMSTKKDIFRQNQVEARNYISQKRFDKSPQAPIGFKSRSTSSYYLTSNR